MPIQKKDGIAFTVDEAAKYLGYSVHTIRQYINRELISASKFGAAVVIDKAECDRFRKEKRSPGRPPKK